MNWKELRVTWVSSVIHATGKQPRSLIFGAAILLLLIVVCGFADAFTYQSPSRISPLARMLGMSPDHPLGTDVLGRDVYSRTLYGGRVSLTVGVLVALLTALVGGGIGLAAGFWRPLDPVLMRVIDGLTAIPPVLLAIALMAITAPSITNVVIAITIGETPGMARLMRSVVLNVRAQPYIDSAIAGGATTGKIIYRHILPNTLPPLAVQAAYVCSSAVLIEASLSFLGCGVSPDTPSWGSVIADGRSVWQVQPLIIFGPAVLLSLAVFSINLLGDGLRDVLDPRSTPG